VPKRVIIFIDETMNLKILESNGREETDDSMIGKPQESGLTNLHSQHP
jgi:hypothetical protein